MNNFYLSPEGDRYYLGTQFTYEGRIYYGNEETFDLLGFTEVVVDPEPNPLYYNIYGVNDDGSWEYEPKNLDEVKTTLIADSSNFAVSTLSATDWYVIRESETGTPVPVAYTNYRQGVRDSNDLYTSLVSSAADMAALQEVGPTPVFPPDPSSAGMASIWVQGTSGSDLLTVLGTTYEDTYLPLTSAQYGQISIGMYLVAPGQPVNGLQITEVLPTSGQIRVSANLAANQPAIAPTISWTQTPIPSFTGVLNTGRGSGTGPNDLNPSWYLSFNCTDPSVTEADTYLYVPSTGVTMPFLPGQVPPGFDSVGNCFNGTDYTIQIKIESRVIATLTVPLGPNTGISFSSF